MNQKTHPLPREIAGIRIPDSALCQKAWALTREVSSDVVFNHAVRTFVFGSLVGQRQKMRFDEELFFLGAIYHDLGLTERFGGTERFEVVGADAADKLLAAEGVSPERREIVWDAIALHAQIGIAGRKRPEIALVHLGAGVDVIGLMMDVLPLPVVGAILEAFPRVDFKNAFVDELVRTFRNNPQATHFTWMADIARDHIHGFQCPSMEHAIRAAPFAE